MDDSGILQAIDRAEAKARRDAERQIREVQVGLTEELTKFSRARHGLQSEIEPPKQRSTRLPTSRRRSTKGRRTGLPKTSPEQLAERRDSVERLVEESRDPVPAGDIGRALALTPDRVKIALRGLTEERRVKPLGKGSATRYATGVKASRRTSKQPPSHGTPEDRVLVVLEDRHQATAEELSQALRIPLGDVVQTCGRLQGEERIHMRRINERPVYVLAVRA